MASEENKEPRRGRHMGAGKHAGATVEQASREGERASKAATSSSPAHKTRDAAPQLVTVTDGDQETRMGDAPRPIDVDPQASGSFSKIAAGEGAQLTTRANAGNVTSRKSSTGRTIDRVRMSSGRPHVEHHEVAVESNKRVFVALGIAALLVVAIVGTLLSRALTSVDTEIVKPVSEQMQVSGNEGIEYRGTTYAVAKQKGGKYALTSTSEGSEGTAVLAELEGTPVTLILYNTIFIIPENLSDGTWDLIAHPLGGGSVTQQVTDGEGAPIVRKGEITTATLEGDIIKIVSSTGEKLEVSLV